MCLSLSKDGLPGSARPPWGLAAHRTKLVPPHPRANKPGPSVPLSGLASAGRACWHHVPREGRSRPSGSQRPGGRSQLRDSNERPPNAPGRHPAQELLMTPQEKGSKALCSPWCRFPVCPEVSNVRSPPPGVPSGGQASHFPFRKGQSKRPGEAHQGETEGVGPRLALPAAAAPLTVPRPAGSPAWVPPPLAFSLIHSFVHQTSPTTTPTLGQALCWVPGARSGV